MGSVISWASMTRTTGASTRCMAESRTDRMGDSDIKGEVSCVVSWLQNYQQGDNSVISLEPIDLRRSFDERLSLVTRPSRVMYGGLLSGDILRPMRRFM
jgi:hypothetical protein